ncbi:MAG: hypothetical protein LBM70_07610 [Victivallales bacterium]|jgi:sugar (pentulose or hexulose) kinase|nr:hypothetical protein [Victivallales bacterium]
MGNFLAFDLGASSGRAILGNFQNGKLSLREIHRFANGPTEKDGAIFWDYPQLCNELKTGLGKALTIEPKLDGIGIDTWGVDYVFFDQKTGKMRRLPYHYRDVRTNNPESDVWSKVPRQELYEKTGIQCMLLNTVYQLAAHFRMHPEDFSDSFLLTMPDALAYYLGGERTSEYTECSTTNLLDPEQKVWDWEIIDRLGLPREVFPKIVKPCTYSGTLSPELQKEFNCSAIPIIKVGSHDTASAVAAVPASERENWAYISAGTWALLGAEIDRPLRTQESEKYSFTNEGGLDGKIRFLTNIMGSWLFQETRRIWNETHSPISFAEMEDMARNATPGKFLINPNDPSFVTPGDMPQRIIDFCERTGQGKIANDSEVVRAIYDSLALYFCSKLGILSRLLKVEYQCLNIVGGGTKDALLMQLTADALNIPVVAGPVEATAIGNLLAQAMAAKEIGSLAEARKVVKDSFEVKTFVPDAKNHAFYNTLSERFETLAK